MIIVESTTTARAMMFLFRYERNDGSDTSKQVVNNLCWPLSINFVLPMTKHGTDRDITMTSESYKQQLYPAHAQKNFHQIMLSAHLGPVAE